MVIHGGTPIYTYRLMLLARSVQDAPLVNIVALHDAEPRPCVLIVLDSGKAEALHESVQNGVVGHRPHLCHVALTVHEGHGVLAFLVEQDQRVAVRVDVKAVVLTVGASRPFVEELNHGRPVGLDEQANEDRFQPSTSQVMETGNTAV